MTARPSGGQRGRPPYPLLTPAEERVLKFLREGKTNAEIGVRLGVSPDGVKYHVSNMLGKLGLSTREELAGWKPSSGNPFGRVWAAIPLVGKAALGAAAVVVAGGVAWGVATRPAQAPVLREGLVTIGYDGQPANGSSTNPQLSADGRYVVFESSASNLVPGDTHSAPDVFRYDRETGNIAWVSEHSSLGGVGPSMTADGRFVAYLVVGGTSSNQSRVMLRDMESGTERTVAGPAILGYAALSPDGRYLAYLSVLTLPHRGDARQQVLSVVDVEDETTVYTARFDSTLDPLARFEARFSPDSKWLLFSAGIAGDSSDCAPEYVDAQIDTERRTVPMSRPMVVELASGQVRCAPVKVHGDTAQVIGIGAASISSGGLVTYTVMHSNSAGWTVWYQPRSGETTALAGKDDLFFGKLSPSGARGMVAATSNDRLGVRFMDVSGTVGWRAVDWPPRFAPDSATYGQPALSADGRQAAFVVTGRDVSSASRVGDIYVVSR